MSRHAYPSTLFKGVTADQANMKLGQQDELFIMLYDKSARLEKDLEEVRWRASVVTTVEDELKQIRRRLCTNIQMRRRSRFEVSAGQSRADPVAAGVWLAEELD